MALSVPSQENNLKQSIDRHGSMAVFYLKHPPRCFSYAQKGGSPREPEPAMATGKTNRAAVCQSYAAAGKAHGTSVHPHARGAYSNRCDGFPDRAGSSPRTWGIHKLPFHHGFGIGSSPRTWGILGVATNYDPGLRFIPTHVGHTTSSTAIFRMRSGSSPRT